MADKNAMKNKSAMRNKGKVKNKDIAKNKAAGKKKYAVDKIMKQEAEKRTAGKMGKKKYAVDKTAKQDAEKRTIGKMEKKYVVTKAFTEKTDHGKSVKEKKVSGKNTSEKMITKKQNADMCQYAKKCGGCDYQGLPYEKQLKEKQEYVRKNVGEFCKVLPIIGMEHPYHYRNKVHAVFDIAKGGSVISGVYKAGTHDVVNIDSCRIEDETADAIIRDIRGLLRSFKIKTYDEDTGYGLLRHVLVRRGFHSGEVMVVLVLGSPILPSKNNFVKALRKLHPEITTVVLNVNDKKTSMILGEKETVIYGKGYIEDTLCGCTFRISPKSFYQVNPVQTEILYTKAIEYAGLTGKERIVDAYCGIGTIGLIAASKAKEVISVELNRDAVRDAVTNAKRNDIKNVQFYNADAGQFMVEMAEYRADQKKNQVPDATKSGKKATPDGNVDVVFMDPPRAGSDEAFLSSVIRLAPKRVVYISCNPETLARDLKYLTKHGYQAKECQPVDLFPWTKHVETVVLLSHKKPDGHINVKVEFGEGEGNVPLDNMVLEYSFEMNAHNRTLLSQIQRASRSADAMRLYPGAFSETLVQLMKEKKLSNKKLADASLVGECTIQRLRNEEEYPTTIQTVLGLCYGLQLSVPEAEMLVGKTDFNIKPTNPQNNAYRCVLSSCAENSIYEINEMLESCGFEPLGSSKLG